MAETVTVRLVKSKIGRPKDQRQTIQGLGLSKINSEKTLQDTPSVRGMINKVSHLVEIKEV